MQFSVMWLPGTIAGVAWSLGNFASMCAVIVLGEAVGYSSCQAAILVSGLWGFFYFGEAPRGAWQWALGALLCTGGIILLSQVTG
jgi:glucose uptake protein GlcU